MLQRSPDPLAVIRGGGLGGNWKKRVGNREEEEWDGRVEGEGVRRDGKGKGGMGSGGG